MPQFITDSTTKNFEYFSIMHSAEESVVAHNIEQLSMNYKKSKPPPVKPSETK